MLDGHVVFKIEAEAGFRMIAPIILHLKKINRSFQPASQATTKTHYDFSNKIFHQQFLAVQSPELQSSQHRILVINRWPFISKNIFPKTKFFFLALNFHRSIKVMRFVHIVAQCDRRRNDNSIKLITYKIIVIPFDSKEVKTEFMLSFNVRFFFFVPILCLRISIHLIFGDAFSSSQAIVS